MSIAKAIPQKHRILKYDAFTFDIEKPLSRRANHALIAAKLNARLDVDFLLN